MNTSELLVPAQAGKHIGGITEKTLAQWRCNRKHLPYVKVGGRVFYRKADLDAFIGRRVVPVVAEAA